MVRTEEERPNVNEAIHAGAEGMQQYMKSLEEQQRLLREQEGTEHEIACQQKKLDEIRQKRCELINETQARENEALKNFQEAKHAAKQTMEAAKERVPEANPGIIERSSLRLSRAERPRRAATRHAELLELLQPLLMT